MCILGSSGSGKSFFVKLNIIRQYFLNKSQYIFDGESEYTTIAFKFKGTCIDFKTSNYNILSFNDFELEDSDFLNKKVSQIVFFLDQILAMSDFEKQVLSYAIIQAYLKKGINSSIESIYYTYKDEKIMVNKKIKTGSDMISFVDVYDEISKYDKDFKTRSKTKKETLNSFKERFKQKIIKELSFLCNNSETNLTNRLVVFDLSKIDKDLAPILVKHFLGLISQKLKAQQKAKKDIKSIIYIDEVWKYISIYGKYKLAEDIFMMYKTIRKLNASIVTITQDILDLFSSSNGEFGKSILNNCAFRMFFKLNFSDSDILQKIGIIDEINLRKLYKLNKGQALLFFNYSNIVLNIKANEFEEKLIEGGTNSEDYSSSR